MSEGNNPEKAAATSKIQICGPFSSCEQMGGCLLDSTVEAFNRSRFLHTPDILDSHANAIISNKGFQNCPKNQVKKIITGSSVSLVILLRRKALRSS